MELVEGQLLLLLLQLLLLSLLALQNTSQVLGKLGHKGLRQEA